MGGTRNREGQKEKKAKEEKENAPEGVESNSREWKCQEFEEKRTRVEEEGSKAEILWP